jgi:predicted Co/Zn/Cd cation transporter (cation efflux family)
MTSNPVGGNLSATTSRRVMAAGAGASLVAAALFTAYQTAWRMYYDYYFYRRVKEEYIALDRHTRVMDALFFAALIVLLYVAYRLLRYAIRPRPRSV